MILNRLGNKTKIAPEIQQYFPQHSIYIELFFGAGGMFFNKPKVAHNFMNDIDDDVYNLFKQVIDNKSQLIESIEFTPINERLFKEWSNGQREEDPVMNAVRFLFISNFGLYGKPGTLRIGAVNPKNVILNNIDATFKYLNGVYFFNSDFRKVFSKCDYKSNKGRTFCYADPPYLETTNNYSESFSEQDSSDLFDTLQESDVKFAMSEFDHPYIIDQAEKRKLNVISVGERKNLLNIRREILITNYTTPQLSMF